MLFLTYTFINWTPQMTTDMLAYISDFISDVSGLMTPIIAVGLGLIIFGAIINAIKH